MQHHTSEESSCHGCQPLRLEATIDSDNPRNREVPGYQCRSNSNWLFHRKHPPTGYRRYRHSPPNSLRFAGKPPCETQTIIQFGPRLSQRLARLVRQDVGEIFFGFGDQVVPFQYVLGADPRVEFSVFLECSVGGVDSGIDVLRAVVRAGCPGFAGARICLRERNSLGLFSAM